MSHTQYPDPQAALEKHFGDVLADLEPEDRVRLKYTFVRQTQLLRDVVIGVDVTEPQREINVQMAHWRAGSLAILAPRFEAAVLEYAEDVGRVLAAFAGGLLAGTIGG